MLGAIDARVLRRQRVELALLARRVKPVVPMTIAAPLGDRGAQVLERRRRRGEVEGDGVRRGGARRSRR